MELHFGSQKQALIDDELRIEAQLKGINPSLIRRYLLSKGIGEDSKWIPSRLTRNEIAWGLFQGGTPKYLVIPPSYSGDHYNIYDAKTGEEAIKNYSDVRKFGMGSLKGVREWFASKGVNLDSFQVMTPTKIKIQDRRDRNQTRINPQTKQKEVQVENPKSTSYENRYIWVSPSEADRMKREKETQKPLMDMDKAKSSLWKKRIQDSIPELDKMLSLKLGVSVQMKITRIDDRYVKVESQEFTKPFGIFEFVIKKAEFYATGSVNVEKGYVWFGSLSLGYEHPGGGTNGSTVHIGSKTLNFQWNMKTGKWEVE